MINGDNVRPLILAGTNSNGQYFMGTASVNNNSLTTLEKKEYIKVIKKNSVVEKGYAGYLFESKNPDKMFCDFLDQNYIPYILGINNIETFQDNDILNINKNVVRVMFRANSCSNSIFVENQCNCNCLMCPEPLACRENAESISLKHILKYISLIKTHPENICITGGEPTLLGTRLFEVFDYCKKAIPNTRILMLTNARLFASKKYTQQFILHLPNELVIGIPLYGATPEIHNAMTNTIKSFEQTTQGIRNLISARLAIEIRIVVTKINYKHLSELADFISSNFPNVYRINIMGLEMTGNAAMNKDKIWVPFSEASKYVETSAIKLISKGIKTYLYNFPLCCINQCLWSITRKSITDYKVRYLEACQGCLMKPYCGGFFSSTLHMNDISIYPITDKDLS